MNTMKGKLTATDFGRRFYDEHKAAGLDYMAFGDWQRRYGRWFVDSFQAKGKRVLDVGCACGAIMRGMAEAGAVVEGVDVSRYMTGLAMRADPTLSQVMFCADARCMPMFEDGRFDVVHSAFVAEHWDPLRVDEILGEVARVTRVKGLAFVSLDTVESLAGAGRALKDEDPTHLCIREISWWGSKFKGAGLRDVTPTWAERLWGHPESMLKDFAWWDFFVLQRE